LVEDSMATVRSIIQSWFYRGRIAYYSALKSPINDSALTKTVIGWKNCRKIADKNARDRENSPTNNAGKPHPASPGPIAYSLLPNPLPPCIH
jgi:hypothetical protein